MQAKLTDEGPRGTKRERNRSHILRRQTRLQRTSHDAAGNKEMPEAAAVATSGRFTSFLVADILGISSYSPTSGDVELVTSSDRPRHQHQHQKSGDFRVERLIHGNDDSKTTSSMSTKVHFYHQTRQAPTRDSTFGRLRPLASFAPPPPCAPTQLRIL